MSNQNNNEEWKGEFRNKFYPYDFANKGDEVFWQENVKWSEVIDFLASQISQAEQRGYERGCDEDNSDEILWKRMKEWNKEWQDENPKERSLTWQDALKLIEWKIEKAEQRGKREGLEEAEEIIANYAEEESESAILKRIRKKINQLK